MSHQPYDPYYLAVAPPVPDYGAGFAGGEKGLINTLFVSGLPDDVKAREIHNLFRRRPGFDSCQLKYTGRGNQVVAFATFFNHQSAIAALHALNGVKFDPQTGSTLHIELARSNSRRKRKPGSGPYVVIDNRSNEASNAREPSSNDDGDSESEDPSEDDNHESGNEDDSETAKSGETTGADGTAEAENSEKPVDGNALSQHAGFKMVKLRGRSGMPVAFADFEEIEQASQAMEGLQGSQLASSDRGGMNIEYARSKMRKH
ncbi:hypothetical protein NL676_026962 [Syzygium grande]|nr:hypothetical protein NL676_026962 [Syzygium grande]